MQKVLKKYQPGILYKSSTENKPFFNKNEIFLKNKSVGINNGETSYYFWVEEEGKRIKARFYRKELFALKGQFE